MVLLLPVFRADLTLLDNHRHEEGEPLPVPLDVLGGEAVRLTGPTVGCGTAVCRLRW